MNMKKIAVLGAGTMSPGIAQSFAFGGYDVCMWNHRDPSLEKAHKMLEANVATFVEEKVYTAEQAEEILSRLTYTTDLEEALKDAFFVQETVAEKPDIKVDILNKVFSLIDEDTIVVSNASSLNPFTLAPEGLLPRFAAAHWFAPPHIIPLVECAKCEQTTQETLDTVMSLLKECGKTPVCLEKFVPGYLINRIQILLNTEVFYLLSEGVCTAEQLDLAVKASLMPRGLLLGLVQRYDFTGLDISANNIINSSYVMPPVDPHPKALFDHVDKGELGVKTGKGFYDYGGRSPQEVSAERDRLLLRIFEANKDIINTQL